MPYLRALSHKRIKSLFLPAWYPWPGDTMSGLFVHYHAVAVSQFADVAVIFTCGVEKNQWKQALTYDLEDGIPVIRSYYLKSDGALKLPITAIRYTLAAFSAYYFLLKKWGKPDVCHVHILTRSSVLALWLKFTSRTPYLITEHWSRYLPKNKGNYSGALRKWFTNLAVRNAGVVTAVSSELIEAMKSHDLQNAEYHYLPNVVDITRFYPAAEKMSSPFTFLHVSCFDEKPKNVKGLLRAWKVFSETAYGCRLILVGDGPDFRTVKQYASEIGIENSTLFTGLLTGKALADVFRDAHCFVLFSHYENQPVVIIEALASGLPVVATRVGGIPDMVNEQNGILVPPGDEEALISAFLRIKENIDLYRAADISAGVKEHFGYEAVGKKIVNFYEFLLRRKA